jgi:6-phosphogluconolactonase
MSLWSGMAATGEALKNEPAVRIVETGEDLARTAAEECVRLALEAVETRGCFSIALAGGSTPKRLYALLASEQEDAFRARFPWKDTHFFWGDERHVPPGHAESNYCMAFETMLSKVPAPPSQIHRIEGENTDASQAAEHYEQDLLRHFQLKQGARPRFDLVLLGMGPDGHTASLFPGTEVLDEQTRLAAAVWVPKFQASRITLTVPLLNQAANILFLVSGTDKAEALRAVLHGEFQPQRYPAQLIQPVQGSLQWLVDRGAASLL